MSITPSTYLGEDVLETIRIGKSITKALFVNSGLFPPRKETGRSEQQVDSEMELYIRIYRLLNDLDGKETTEIEDSKLPPIGGKSCEKDICGLRCGGGRSGFVVNWKGILMPCNRLDKISADLMENSFKHAWASVNREANNWPQVPECQGCAYRNVCNKCAARMLQYAEPGKQPYGLCEQTKEFVKHGILQILECE